MLLSVNDSRDTQILVKHDVAVKETGARIREMLSHPESPGGRRGGTIKGRKCQSGSTVPSLPEKKEGSRPGDTEVG